MWQMARAWSTPRTQIVLAVGALTLLALALRLTCIGQSLFGDELYLYSAVHDRSLGGMLAVVHDTEKTPPLYFLLAWVTARGAHATELVRLPSVLAGTSSVPLVYVLGREAFSRASGLVAAACIALSPFAIFYGTEARGYSLVAALVVLSTVALLQALRDGRRRWWLLHGAAALAALYTHYIAAL